MSSFAELVGIGKIDLRRHHKWQKSEIICIFADAMTVSRNILHLMAAAVVDANNGVEQAHDYTVSGVPATRLGQTVDHHLHTGKPWLGFNGLGWYDNRARVLDALTGRFTTPDPLCERYPDQSPYLFCSGNPVKMVDEDGKDGIVSIYGPKISISANIYLYGTGANSYVRDTFQSEINSKWSNRTYSIQHNNKVFQTSVEGNVYLQRGLYPIGRFSPWDRNNYVYVSDDIKTSTVNNYGIDYNEWRSRGRNGESLSQDNPAPHEFGHLLGLPDMYYKDTQEPISG